jgi:parallel beta-helix repeat protein
MQNNLLKKLFVIGIINLFFFISITSSIASVNVKKSCTPTLLNGNILYVGGDGPGNYTKIQNAIENSTNGDTVFVYDESSPYYESIQINKSINLIGEDRNTTIIDAKKKCVVFISSDDVKIQELTIQNSSWGGSGIEIDRGFGFFNISYNNIFSNFNGIIIPTSSNNNTIKGNKFFDNEGFTIAILFSDNNTITGNTIDHPIGAYPADGIGIHHGKRNNISGNTIKNCDSGVCLSHESDYNIILNNVISSGEYDGIRITGGSNNTIIGNNISYNLYWGIEIQGAGNDNIIYHNNLLHNYENAIDEGNNTWDDGEFGNYWSDYEQKYPNAKKLRKEGIWDTPYEIPSEFRGDNYDTRPLIWQWPKSKSAQNNENIWIHRLLDRFPTLQKILDALDKFFDFYGDM